MGAESHTNYALRKNGLQEIVPIHPELKEAEVRDITAEFANKISVQGNRFTVAIGSKPE